MISARRPVVTLQLYRWVPALRARSWRSGRAGTSRHRFAWRVWTRPTPAVKWPAGNTSTARSTKDGATLDFYLADRRNTKAAKRFLAKALRRSRDWTPRVDQHRQEPGLRRGDRRAERKGGCRKTPSTGQVKYLNNRLEGDHGQLKRLIRPTLGFQSMKTAYATIKGFEVMRMFRRRHCTLDRSRRHSRSAIRQQTVRSRRVIRLHEHGTFMRRRRLMQHGVIAGGCFPAASSLTGLGLALAKESSHGAVCWPGRITEGDEPLRGGSNGHDPLARQVCVDT